MSVVESDENVGESVTALRDLFHFGHFKSFYKLYVPIAIVIGVIAGLFMVVFQWLIIGFTTVLSGFPIFVAPILGGLFSGFMIYIGRKEVQGSGISTAIEMTHEPTSLDRGTAVTKLLATSISIGSGNPVGREGPAVLIGASIGNSIGRRLGFHEDSHLRIFLMMGSAAATAGIYKAPLGGALFATEAPYRRDARLGYFIPTVIAALTSYIVYAGIMGIDPILQFAASFTLTFEVLPMLIIFGALAGGISILFAVVLMITRNFFTLKLPNWVDPIAGSTLACIAIFITGIAVDPSLTIAGMGYEVINSLANSTVPITILFMLLIGKLFASSFVVAGRVSGGVLASSLFVGAMLGAIFGEVFYPEAVGAFIVLGMGAVLAATTNTPVATTVMMLEMSHSFDLVIPLALCIAVAYLVSGGSSLYEGQKVSRDDEDEDYYKLAKQKPDPEDVLALDGTVSNPSGSKNTLVEDEDAETEEASESS
ncbi:MAG: chloride channel protein [Candidatus Thorarchaeota archaeon]